MGMVQIRSQVRDLSFRKAGQRGENVGQLSQSLSG